MYRTSWGYPVYSDQGEDEWVYGIKFFRTDKKGRLVGAYKQNYVYKRKGWNALPKGERPSICSRGFHAYTIDYAVQALRRHYGQRVFVVAIRNVAAVDPEGKFVGDACRIVKEIDMASLRDIENKAGALFQEMLQAAAPLREMLASERLFDGWNTIRTAIDESSVSFAARAVHTLIGSTNYQLITMSELDKYIDDKKEAEQLQKHLQKGMVTHNGYCSIH